MSEGGQCAEPSALRRRRHRHYGECRALRGNGGRGGSAQPLPMILTQRMYDAHQFTMAEIAASCGVTPMTIYRNIRTDSPQRTETTLLIRMCAPSVLTQV